MLELGLAVLVIGVGVFLYKRGKKNDKPSQGSVPPSGGSPRGDSGRNTHIK